MLDRATQHDRLVKLAEVTHITGVHKSQIYTMIREGRFPRQIKHGRASRWSMHDLQRWVEEQKAESRAAA